MPLMQAPHSGTCYCDAKGAAGLPVVLVAEHCNIRHVTGMVGVLIIQIAWPKCRMQYATVAHHMQTMLTSIADLM